MGLVWGFLGAFLDFDGTRSNAARLKNAILDLRVQKRVRFFGDGIRTASVVMQSNPPRVRFIDTIHVEQSRMVRVRF